MRRFVLLILLAWYALARPGDLCPGAGFDAPGRRAQGIGHEVQAAAGKFYPGTPHDYAIYVPAQYDAAKPTPFMIFLDGSGALGNGVRVPVVFDNLIAKHDLPPMIGIFVDPGVLPAALRSGAEPL